MLNISNLSVRFSTNDGEITAVDDLSLSLDAGKTFGLVGESGSGKSQTMHAVLGLLASNGTASGSVEFNGQEILNLPAARLNEIRGAAISMIFQDPMTSLNPYMTVGRQLTEVLELHKGMSRRDATAEAIRMLDAVHIPQAATRLKRYPHEFSGGMRQRLMIAMALLCKPKLLIADEPTTALDVTVQAQIMELLTEIRREFSTSVILITHDLGVASEFCDELAVMYAGRIVEQAPAQTLLTNPWHPYSRGLIDSVPKIDSGDVELATIPGTPPDPREQLPGCRFAPRCAWKMPQCELEDPRLRPVDDSHARACLLDAAPTTQP